MKRAERKSFGKPDEVRKFPKGKVELVKIGGAIIPTSRDAQAGLETGLTLMLAAAAGADIFGHMGISGVDQASSLDMLVFQDEVISYVESVMREMDFSEEAFGFEESLAVGPGGSFIEREHTARHFRKELWFPKLLDREYYQVWLDAGAVATEELLAAHRPEPVSDDLRKALDEIVGAARRDLL